MRETRDSEIVFNLDEALSEIRALRSQKSAMMKALKKISGQTGGTVGEDAARIYWAVKELSN